MRSKIVVVSLLTFLACIFLCLTPRRAPADDPKAANLDSLAWMTGSWLERKTGVDTEEHWIEPKGDVMLGLGRTVRANGKTSFEFMRIAKTPTGISYFASPGGRPAVEFPLKKQEGKKAVFENPKHAYPSTITYWLDDDGFLHARIEGTVKGEKQSEEWKWKKQTNND